MHGPCMIVKASSLGGMRMHLYNEEANKSVRMKIDKLAAADFADVPEQKFCTSLHDDNRRIY